MSRNTTVASRQLWTTSLISVAICLLLFLLFGGEFVRIGVMKKVEGYNFGGEGPTFWYYKNAQTYSNYSLILAIYFLILSGLSFWAFKHRNEKLSLAILLIVVFSTLMQMLHWDD